MQLGSVRLSARPRGLLQRGVRGRRDVPLAMRVGTRWSAFSFLPLLLSFGCTTRVVLGFEDAGTSGGASMTNGAASSTGAEATSGTTGGQNTGTGSTGGASAGSATGNETHGSTGTTGGTTTGDAGACLLNSAKCSSNDRCCSGACDNVCDQPFGKGCLGDGDCASSNCVNELCACSNGGCASGSGPAALGCTQVVLQGVQAGVCCAGVGSSCSGTFDFCDQNCVNGQCQCVPTGSRCYAPFNACCVGVCESNTCRVMPGSACEASTDCVTQNCDGGICGACGLSSAPCAGDADCCSGYACGSTPYVDQSNPGQVLDAGSDCCGDIGTPCGPGTDFIECCGVCTGSQHLCLRRSQRPLLHQQDVLRGGACMTSAIDGGSLLACCQMNSQLCFSKDECCSGNCSGQVCACVQAGGTCGPAGSYAAQGPAACCSGACGDAGTCL